MYADNIQQTGDALRIILPSIAFGVPLYLEDYKGLNQYSKAFILNGAATYALKFNIHKTRPDGSDDYSFPSGHTSLAFNASTFIHVRYGFKYAIASYLAAGFVAYSRVESDKHYIEDVAAGALIGSLSAYILTSPYENINIQPLFSENYKGLLFSYNF